MEGQTNESSPGMDVDELLEKANIRPTAVRKMVWRTICKFDYAFSLSDVENVLYTVDKSTLFRSLSLFKERELLHEIDDGSGSVKYCVCDCCPDHSHHRHHVHITCTRCQKTFCLKDVSVPSVNLPKDFEVEEICYLVKGICAQCREKRR